MKTYYLIVGVLCILHYLILVAYSRRLKVTFAGFWLIAGGAHLICGCAPFPFLKGGAVCAAVCVLWIFFLGVEARIAKEMFRKTDRYCDYVIVLGAQVRGTRITESLLRRLKAAEKYLLRFKEAKVIVSGGRGPGEDISEAEAMAQWLEKKGIEPERIIKEDRSVSTRENLKFSRKYLRQKDGSVLIVTNGFHLYRASLIARSEGYMDVELLPASVNPVFFLNYMVREFFALIPFACYAIKNKNVKV